MRHFSKLLKTCYSVLSYGILILCIKPEYNFGSDSPGAFGGLPGSNSNNLLHIMKYRLNTLYVYIISSNTKLHADITSA